MSLPAADGVLRVWSASCGGRPVLSLPGGPTELLSCDWSPYSGHLLASAATDGCLRLWDARSPQAPLQQLTVRTAVRRPGRAGNGQRNHGKGLLEAGRWV